MVYATRLQRRQRESCHSARRQNGVAVCIPDVRGNKIAQKLRKIDKNIMIIILTGYSRFKDSVDAVELGVYKILMKPISNRILLATVESAVSAYKANARSHTFVRIER